MFYLLNVSSKLPILNGKMVDIKVKVPTKI